MEPFRALKSKKAHSLGSSGALAVHDVLLQPVLSLSWPPHADHVTQLPASLPTATQKDGVLDLRHPGLARMAVCLLRKGTSSFFLARCPRRAFS